MICFLQDERSGYELLFLLNKFKLCSGLGVNLNKSEAIWIGRCKQFKPGTLPIKWSEGTFFTLGIWF